MAMNMQVLLLLEYITAKMWSRPGGNFIGLFLSIIFPLWNSSNHDLVLSLSLAISLSFILLQTHKSQHRTPWFLSLNSCSHSSHQTHIFSAILWQYQVRGDSTSPRSQLYIQLQEIVMWYLRSLQSSRRLSDALLHSLPVQQEPDRTWFQQHFGSKLWESSARSRNNFPRYVFLPWQLLSLSRSPQWLSLRFLVQSGLWNLRLVKMQALMEESQDLNHTDGNGSLVHVPIRCACHDVSDIGNGTNFLVTYPVRVNLECLKIWSGMPID